PPALHSGIRPLSQLFWSVVELKISDVGFIMAVQQEVARMPLARELRKHYSAGSVERPIGTPSAAVAESGRIYGS
ncbi:hypothetical protein, partial [Streptomyces telluris]|uniref:hypothetical protein n=1 Tax=Streptomyces telluris TaxID=2720021 RepID=UPI0019D0D146